MRDDECIRPDEDEIPVITPPPTSKAGSLDDSHAYAEDCSLKRVVWERIVLAALLCLAGSILSCASFWLGLAEDSLLAPAGILFLAACGLGFVALAPALAARRAPLIAYRILYHSPTSLGGAEATRLLSALARHCGHMSISWRFQPTRKGSATGDLSLYIVAPAKWGRVLEGILPRLLPNMWAERVPPPAPPGPTSPGRGVRCWRREFATAMVHTSTSAGTLADPLASGAHMAELASLLQARDLEVQIHLWKSGVACLLLAECDLVADQKHKAIVGSRRGTQFACKTIRCAGHTMKQGAVLSRDTKRKTEKSQGAGSSPAGADHRSLPLPGLKPLLGGWLTHWEAPPEASKVKGKGHGKARAQGGEDPPEVAVQWVEKSTAQTLGDPKLSGLLPSLASLLCSYYPLWEEWPRHATATATAIANANASATPLADGKEDARTENSPGNAFWGGSHGRRASSWRLRGGGREQGFQQGVSEEIVMLLFPPTVGANAILDSFFSKVVPPPASYSLPARSDRVLVLGRTTAEDRPFAERVVGVPVLTTVSGTDKPRPLASSNGPRSAMTGPLREAVTATGLHDFTQGGVLVVGGTDAWRLDVAGSLARQGAEMGMPLFVIEGGPPPDEPPPVARRGARIEGTDAQSSSAATIANKLGDARTRARAGAGNNGDPFSPGALGLGGIGVRDKRAVLIDMGNPDGSVHINMLFVSPPLYAPNAAAGEAAALTIALKTALPAQMHFLDAVGVTGTGTGDTVLEAWLWVLLVRHHYSRLWRALHVFTRSPLAEDELSGRTGAIGANVLRGESTGSSGNSGSTGPSRFMGDLPSDTGKIEVLPCPDLPTLLLLMEQSDALVSALHRERTAWTDPRWVGTMKSLGAAGDAALESIWSVHERIRGVADLDPGDLFRLCAGLRDRLKGAIGQPEMLRMLSGPPVSLHDLLDGGPPRLLRANLEGAYRAAQPPYMDAEGARKRYGLYLLWAVWALAQGRAALSRMGMAPVYTPARTPPASTSPTGSTVPQATQRGAARPVMLILHGAGAWFGSGSPLSSVRALRSLGVPEAGLMVGVTVAGLRHVRSHGADAYSAFRTLVVGSLPVGYEDAPDADLRQLEREGELHREGMEIVAHRIALAWGLPRIEGSPADPARLLRVLRRLSDGDALVLAPMPRGKLTLCTATTGSGPVEAIRSKWSREAREPQEAAE